MRERAVPGLFVGRKDQPRIIAKATAVRAFLRAADEFLALVREPGPAQSRGKGNGEERAASSSFGEALPPTEWAISQDSRVIRPGKQAR